MGAEGEAGRMFVEMMCGELAGQKGAFVPPSVMNESMKAQPIQPIADKEKLLNDFAKSTFTANVKPILSTKLVETKKAIEKEQARDFQKEALDESQQTLAKLLKSLV